MENWERMQKLKKLRDSLIKYKSVVPKELFEEHLLPLLGWVKEQIKPIHVIIHKDRAFKNFWRIHEKGGKIIHAYGRIDEAKYFCKRLGFKIDKIIETDRSKLVSHSKERGQDVGQ